MFEQSMIPEAKSKRWSWVAALLGQMLAIGVIILIPLMYVDALPTADLTAMLVAPPPPPPPPPPPAPAAAKVAPRRLTPVRQFDVHALTAPKTVPKQIAVIEDMPADTSAVATSTSLGGVPGGVSGGVPGGVLGSILNTENAPAPPPPPAPKTAAPAALTPRTVHVGGNVEAAMLVSGPKPAYPEVARQARIQGTVELKAIIGKDGKVQDLKVMNGNPLLVNSALDAVRKWVYKPTLLNGVPVNVATEIDVTFTLG